MTLILIVLKLMPDAFLMDTNVHLYLPVLKYLQLVTVSCHKKVDFNANGQHFAK